jgi:hypothetical protein
MVYVQEAISVKVRDFLAQVPAVSDEVRERMEKVVTGDIMYLAHMAMDDEIQESLEMLEAEGKEVSIEICLYLQDQTSNE